MPEYPPRGVSPGPLGADARGGGGISNGGGSRLGSGVPRGPYGNPNHANHSDQDLLNPGVPSVDRRSSNGSIGSYNIRIEPPVSIRCSGLSSYSIFFFISLQISGDTETDYVYPPVWSAFQHGSTGTDARPIRQLFNSSSYALAPPPATTTTTLPAPAAAAKPCPCPSRPRTRRPTGQQPRTHSAQLPRRAEWAPPTRLHPADADRRTRSVNTLLTLSWSAGYERRYPQRDDHPRHPRQPAARVSDQRPPTRHSRSSADLRQPAG